MLAACMLLFSCNNNLSSSETPDPIIKDTVIYYSNGLKYCEGKFEDELDDRIGEWKFYNPDGSLDFIEKFAQSGVTLLTILDYDNGKLLKKTFKICGGENLYEHSDEGGSEYLSIFKCRLVENNYYPNGNIKSIRESDVQQEWWEDKVIFKKYDIDGKMILQMEERFTH